MQPDLFSTRSLELKPFAGRTEPRLWVRRLIIWEEPGKEIRNVALKPGFNVVWSPDDGSQQGQIGHGGGKTTFCRLLRYCLGEGGFGPDSQRRAVLEMMPAAQVGAEVRLDGETWLIRRSLGIRGDDFAVQGPSFAEISSFPTESTGMRPFRDAATRAFLSDALQLVPASIGGDEAWLALLAWMTRDQECRFGHLLDWRSPDSGSHSPVSGRNRSQEDRLAVARIVLNALQQVELETDKTRDAVNSALADQRIEANRISWSLAKDRRTLAKDLSLNSDNTSGLDPAIIKSKAAERLARAQGVPIMVTVERIRTAREDLESAVRKQEQAHAAITIADAKIEAAELVMKTLADQLPELTAQNQRLSNPVCPTCGVLIDKARAEGCGISLQDCDLEAQRLRVAEKLEMHKGASAEAARLRNDVPTLRRESAIADQQLQRLRVYLSELERAANDRSEAIRSAELVWDKAVQFERASVELETIESAIVESEGTVRVLTEELDVHRSNVAGLVTQLSDRFDALFREVTPIEARCSVKLDGHGFGLKVPVDGEAIGSVKIAVFDLAVLSMAIEGVTRHPGFLIHDSPREADLGRTIYAGLFELAKKLERFGPAPLFQYVLTTTTEPPLEFRSAPFLRLTVKGAPAEERLFKKNL